MYSTWRVLFTIYDTQLKSYRPSDMMAFNMTRHVRTGVFGGTFDPIHIGHLIVAETVLSDLDLNRILFVPAAYPYHKGVGDITNPDDRSQMVRLAIEGHPELVLSDVDLNHERPSYTVETLKRIKASTAFSQDDLYFLMGADCLHDLENWKEPERIFDLAAVVVFNRSRFDSSMTASRFSDRIIVAKTPRLDIASSVIRERIKTGQSIRYWVPDLVESYIREKGLYR